MFRKKKGEDNTTDKKVKAPKKPLTVKERAKRKKRIYAGIAVVMAVIIAGTGIRFFMTSNKASADDEVTVSSAEVESGDVATTIDSSGSISNTGTTSISIPDSIEVEEVLVSEGDTVSAGDNLASVDTATVASALVEINDLIDDLEDEIDDLEDDDDSDEEGTDEYYTLISYNAQLEDLEDLQETVEAIYESGYITADTDGIIDTISVSDSSSSSSSTTSTETTTTGSTDTSDDEGVTTASITATEVATIAATTVSDSTSYVTTSTSDSTTTTTTTTTNSSDSNTTSNSSSSGSTDSSAAATTTTSSTESTSTESTDSSSSEYSVSTTDAFTIASSTEATITVEVDELDISSVEVGQNAVVTLDAFEDEEFEGTVTDVAASSSNSGTYEVEITISREDGMLAGMSATVTINIEEVNDVLVVPVSALVEDGSTYYVYTEVDEEGNLSGKTEVEVGLSNGTYAEITSGLSLGDTVYYTKQDSTDSDSDSSSMMGGGMGGGSGEMPSGGGGDMGGGQGGAPGGN